MADVIALAGKVSGKVQGVGFRFFTQNMARYLALVGYVRNTDAGEVEFHIQGGRLDLDKMLLELHSGPPFADVVALECNEVPVEAMTDFVIRY